VGAAKPVINERRYRRDETAAQASVARAEAAPAADDAVAALLRLQRGAGNASVTRMLARTPLARKDVPEPVYDKAPAEGKNALDERAKKIVAIISDTTKTPEVRGVETVKAIVKEYYPSEASKVKDVVWDPDLTEGLETEAADFKDAKGKIKVGPDFVERFNVDNPSRWILAVGHEILHINQHRAGGMGGPAKAHEREFLANRWTAITPEASGTGRLNAPTRVSTIDVAIKRYFKMPEDDRKKYKTEYEELLELRKKTRDKAKDPSKIPENPPTGGG
jgi:hypothetical protein